MQSALLVEPPQGTQMVEPKPSWSLSSKNFCASLQSLLLVTEPEIAVQDLVSAPAPKPSRSLSTY